MERAASLYGDGEAEGFDQLAKDVATDLASVVEVERIRAKMGGREKITPSRSASRASSRSKMTPGSSFIATRARSRRLGRRIRSSRPKHPAWFRSRSRRQDDDPRGAQDSDADAG